MLINLIQQQLLDLQKMCNFVGKAAKMSLGQDYDDIAIQRMYSTNRERLLDIVRELDLGHQVDWDRVSGMLRTMDEG